MAESLWSYALTTLARTKTFLQVSGTTYDDVITMIINSVSEECERYCGTYLSKRETVTEYYDSEGGYKLFLDNIPTSEGAISTLHDDTDREFEDDDLVDSDDYVVDYEKGIIIREDEEFAVGNQSIKVVWTKLGYTTIPKPLEMACWIWCAYVFDKYTEKRWGKKSVSSAGETVSEFIVDEPPPEVRVKLDLYRKVTL